MKGEWRYVLDHVGGKNSPSQLLIFVVLVLTVTVPFSILIGFEREGVMRTAVRYNICRPKANHFNAKIGDA